MNRIAIIGGGAWGTALSTVVSSRFDTVQLWVREDDLAARMTVTHVNDIFLPGVRLPRNVLPTNSLEAAVSGADLILSVVPSSAVRPIFRELVQYLSPGTPVVSATKGLETGTLMRMSEVIVEVVAENNPVAALSGPSFALEVAGGVPTAVVLAAADPALARDLQIALSGPNFRIYTSADLPGVEIGGALKNVIAIGAGICDGLKIGHNAMAALITRGLAELTRLALAVGGRAETLAGLSGLGDLILTCFGDLSRNRQVGLKLAAGLKLEGILSSTASVAEGVKTTAAAKELAARHSIEMPIVEEMHGVLQLGRAPGEAIRRLMTRELRAERA